MMMYRRLRYPAAWSERDFFQREMNRLFSRTTCMDVEARGYPAVNVWADEDAQLVTAEMPGVDMQDIEISVLGDVLTLSGSRKEEELPEDSRYHRRERSCGTFTRSVQLPYPVDADKVEATLEKGVLHIRLPRAEESRPRKIAVRSA
jgi:HSP20 family protein